MEEKIRVLLADDHAILRSGLRLLINSQSDMCVVGEAGDVAEAIARAEGLQPDLALLDLSMPGSRAELIGSVQERSPRTRVVVLTMHEEPAYLHAALSAGAAGYVVKRAADTDLLTAIRVVHRGGTFVEPTLAASLMRPAAPAPTGAAVGLSRQERRVLQLLAEGHTNQAIADTMSLSVKTVETYRARLSEKLGLRSRAELFRFAVDAGLLDLSPKAANGDEGDLQPSRKQAD